MRMPGLKTAKTFSRWLRARIVGGGLILGYHRVASLTQDTFEVCVAPEHFAEQMDVLRTYARPVPLPQLVQCLKEGAVPSGLVAVTFDDGYADNLYQAKPILEKYDVPATVFVCTGYIGKEFWWDELDRLVMSSGADLDALQLETGKKRFAWNMDQSSRETDSIVRSKFLRAVYNLLLRLDVAEQLQAIEIIRRWAGSSSGDVTARAMTAEELTQIAAGGLIRLGAHTRHHPALPHISHARQSEEILGSKRDLKSLLGTRVAGFAYPNGLATDETKTIVREAGFDFACTSLHNVVNPASDLYALTRFWQKDVDGETFLRGLRLWMKGGAV